MSVKLSEHEEYQLNLDLFGAVVVENTKIEFLSTKSFFFLYSFLSLIESHLTTHPLTNQQQIKVVISLEKKTAGSWADLEKVTVPADVKSIETEVFTFFFFFLPLFFDCISLFFFLLL